MVDFYDEFPYETNPFPETHPGNLAGLGRLFGIRTAVAQQCRVLELGAATGGNIIPMAWYLPDSEFTGVELSLPQVEIGNRLIQSLKLVNIHLEAGDILELDAARLGQFDYIIVHGVYSWVPVRVREKILQLMQMCLAPDGIAYISYNVLPGWRLRGSLRDFLLYATCSINGANNKYTAAVEALQRLQQSLQDMQSDSQPYMQKEIAYLLKAHPGYLLHEYLAGENNAFLFTDFLDDISRHNLQYVCETDLHTLFDSTLPAKSQAALEDIDDPLQHEQWMDFVRMRTFRQSLICRADLSLDREIDLDVFANFFISSNLRPKSRVALNNRKSATFLFPDNTELNVAHPLTKAALLYLRGVHPYTPSFTDLCAFAVDEVCKAGAGRYATETTELLTELFSLYSYRGVLGHVQPCLLQARVSDYPQASELARLQAQEGWTSVATIHHLTLGIDSFARCLLQHLDGQHSVMELAELLLDSIKSGVVRIPGGKQAQSAGKGLEKEVQDNIRHLLHVFARHGLLEQSP